MEKIEKALLDLIKKDPNLEHQVVIVFDPKMEFSRLNLPNTHLIMHNIASASLPGHQLSTLAEQDSIISIEMDKEAGIS